LPLRNYASRSKTHSRPDFQKETTNLEKERRDQ
jgi:hypothetical protein